MDYRPVAWHWTVHSGWSMVGPHEESASGRGREMVALVRWQGTAGSCTQEPGTLSIAQAKGGDMKRTLLLLLLLLGVGVCMTTPSYAQDLINGALTAMGGADTLAQVKTLVVKGTVRYWEPEQSMVAGGEMRHTAEQERAVEVLVRAAVHADDGDGSGGRRVTLAVDAEGRGGGCQHGGLEFRRAVRTAMVALARGLSS